MIEIAFGGYALPVLLTVFLALVYKIMGENIKDRWKAMIAVGFGMCLGAVYVPYEGLAFTAKNFVDYILNGFMVGASAVGIYEVQRSVKNPRT